LRTEDFYAFMRAREALRLRKASGSPWPWSDDEILNTYKFTNVNREHDRTTMWMREHWTDPHKNGGPATQLFNCALFRYFGTMEFAKVIGYQLDWNPTHAVRVKNLARQKLEQGEKVFTGAYVITNQGISAPKYEVVVDHFLTPFWEACPSLVMIAQNTNSWEKVIHSMGLLKGFGGTGFMAKEVLLDAMHCTGIFPNGQPADFNTWCPLGPGARRGLNRVLGRYTDASMKKTVQLDFMKELYRLSGFPPDAGMYSSSLWPTEFVEDGAVELDLHTIQFQLCEFDKYERTRLGEGRPRSKYHHG
jgi:hypothetical protein